MKYALAALVSIPWIIVAITEYQDYAAEERPVESAADVKKFSEVWKEIADKAEQPSKQSSASSTPFERMGEIIGQGSIEFRSSGLILYRIKTEAHGTVAVHSALPIDTGTVVEVVKYVTMGSDKQPTEIYWAKELSLAEQAVWSKMKEEKTDQDGISAQEKAD